MLERAPCLHSPRWHLMQTSQMLTSGALCQPLGDCNSRVCAFGCTSDHEPWLCCCIGEVFAHGKHEYMNAQRMTSFANSRLTCHQARSESEQADDARTVIWPRGPRPLLTRCPLCNCRQKGEFLPGRPHAQDLVWLFAGWRQLKPSHRGSKTQPRVRVWENS
jgi:hypothetical protein